MRRGLTALAVAGALAGLFISASHNPGPPRLTERVTTGFLAFTLPSSCSVTPLGIDCATHAQAERIRAQFAKYEVSVPVDGTTVALPLPIPTPEPSAGRP